MQIRLKVFEYKATEYKPGVKIDKKLCNACTDSDLRIRYSFQNRRYVLRYGDWILKDKKGDCFLLPKQFFDILYEVK